MTYTSTRTCRPCNGTGVGKAWGADCQACHGTGNAAPEAPPRLRRGRVPENEPERAREEQLDQLARLIDRCDPQHPEVQGAAAAIGPDLLAEQANHWIALLRPLVPPRRRATTRQPAYQPTRKRASARAKLIFAGAVACFVVATLAAADLDGGEHPPLRCAEVGSAGIECMP